MAKWELVGATLFRGSEPILHLGPSALNPVTGQFTRERIVALLNAAEPGGVLDQVLEEAADTGWGQNAVTLRQAIIGAANAKD